MRKNSQTFEGYDKPFTYKTNSIIGFSLLNFYNFFRKLLM